MVEYLMQRWNPRLGQKDNGEVGHRSPYLLHAKQALYHLSYIPRVLIPQELSKVYLNILFFPSKNNLCLIKSRYLSLYTSIIHHQPWQPPYTYHIHPSSIRTIRTYLHKPQGQSPHGIQISIQIDKNMPYHHKPH